MRGEKIIWANFGESSANQWNEKFSLAERKISESSEISTFFTQRMQTAVAVLSSIYADLRNNVRNACQESISVGDFENSANITSEITRGVLERCIETIDLQYKTGIASGKIDRTILDDNYHESLQSARARHLAVSQSIMEEFEKREEQLTGNARSFSKNSHKNRHTVCFIHGIRTRAEWAERSAALLKKFDSSIRAVPLRYGFFDAIRFLLPWSRVRSRPINRISKLLRDEIARNPEKISIVAHSFGTYIFAKILETNSDIKFHRIILCGSIISEDFQWENYSHRLESDVEGHWHVVNDCGMKDIWPVLAASSTWGYGASGRFGFGHGRVKDRFFDAGHGDFFSDDHIKKNWLPYLSMGIVEEGILQRATNPLWVSLLSVLKVRYLAAALIAGLIFSIVIYRDSWLRPPSSNDILDRPDLHIGITWENFKTSTEKIQLSTTAEPGKIIASYDGVFWNIPAKITHEFLDGRLATSLISIKAEDCDATFYDENKNPTGTANRRCGIGFIVENSKKICNKVDEKYQELIKKIGPPVDRLESTRISEQWLSNQIIKQHSGNGWQQQWLPGGKNDAARLERFKADKETFVQFQLLTWDWNYWTLDPSRQPNPNSRLGAPFPAPLSDNYERSGCFLQYKVTGKANASWDFSENKN